MFMLQTTLACRQSEMFDLKIGIIESPPFSLFIPVVCFKPNILYKYWVEQNSAGNFVKYTYVKYI